MSVEGIILHHGEAGGVTLHETRVDYLLTAENSKQCSLFEFTIAPGFNTGAHYHTKIEELFYVLEGELDLRCGDKTVRGGPGTFVFVPPGAAHAFGNSGSSPGRMLLITAPPGHENTSTSCATWSPRAESRIPTRSPSCAQSTTRSSLRR
jgi:quercetin dioxygenase-like cupin family protein